MSDKWMIVISVVVLVWSIFFGCEDWLGLSRTEICILLGAAYITHSVEKKINIVTQDNMQLLSEIERLQDQIESLQDWFSGKTFYESTE